MRNLFLTLSFLFLSFVAIQAQTLTVSGTVIDSSNTPLMGATVVLLQAEDSVLSSFALSDKTGAFRMRRVKSGQYILQITYLGYQQINKRIELSSESTDYQAGTFSMKPRDLTLGAVDIEAEQAPILIKKDTIEYNAGSFNTQPNSVVEDLLKKLPGVEVDRDGTIKAQGKTVNKVLVDGKEFFGDDPKIATKNLPADAVKKVQVFDKKSEMAEFTGIDDGQRNKTINLKLKDGKKKGVFGNVTGGYGTDDRYEGRLNLNRFNKKMQLSAIGMLNNTNQQGFSINDYISLMGGLQNMISGGGGGGRIELNLNASDLGVPITDGLGDGFTDTGAGGLNFNYDFNKKTELSTSYFYSKIKHTEERFASRQNFLAEERFNSDENSDMLNHNQNHRLALTFRHKIDSFQNIIFRLNGGFNDAESESNNQSQVFNPKGILENEGIRSNDTEGTNLKLNSNFMYRRKFRKKGRSFVANLLFGNQDDSRLAYLDAVNRFYSEDPINYLADSLLQSQDRDENQYNYGLQLAYTEPLGKGFYLGINLSHQNFDNAVNRDVFDLLPNGTPAEIHNLELSTLYQRDYFFNKGGLDLRVNRQKYSFNIGANVQQSRLKGTIGTAGNLINQSWTFLLPKMRWNYEFTSTRNFSIDYSTSVREPSVEQLQPIVDNSNPLRIYKGNPNLRPEYSHRLGLDFMSFSAFSFVSFMVGLDAAYTQNKITNSQTIDAQFRQTFEPINVTNDLRLMNNLSFSAPLKPLGIRISLNTNLLYNRGLQFINTEENTLNRLISSGRITLDNRNKNIVDIAIGTRLTHNLTRYSVNETLNQDFLNQEYFTDVNITLAKTWAVGTSMNYFVYAGDAFNASQTIPLWTASLSKFILKNNRGQLKLSAFDLLNKNVGFNRTTQANYILEERILSLGRYFMLSFTYNLSKFGKAGESNGPGGGLRIMGRR